jgi:hypothetical protein
MATNMQKAQALLFGKDGLGAVNVKLFPGTSRESSSEEVAGALADSLERLASGELEEATLD